MTADWNPWHGCTKLSPGCKYCYVYRQDEQRGSGDRARICRKTANFDLPLKRKRDKTWKIPSGALVYTCFSSDFLLEEADGWRADCWRMMKERSDCRFYFFTKRIDRLADCLPSDWGGGYDNVMIGCTVENQDRADYRLPVFRSLPIRHRSIIVAPMLERIDLSAYLDHTIEEVACSGESGQEARSCDYDWVLQVREQCVKQNIPFLFHQTGAHFVKDGKLYNIPRRFQRSQAHKAGIDFRIREDREPETAASETAASETAAPETAAQETAARETTARETAAPDSLQEECRQRSLFDEE